MFRAAALLLAVNFLWSGLALAKLNNPPAAKPDVSKDLLIKFRNIQGLTEFTAMAHNGGAKVETLGTGDWLRVRLNNQQLHSLNIKQIRSNPNVLHVQPNYPIRLPEDYKTSDPVLREKLMRVVRESALSAPADNPEIPESGAGGSGADPLFDRQWGMNDIGAKDAQSISRRSNAVRMTSDKDPVVVAVIDTGVDYTHEDLVDNMWRNEDEIPNNGIDDDKNGYVDDIVGWDFVANDNKPYDLTLDPMVIILMGGNPGHGTHCAGNVAAVANNGKGITGVAPNAKIMALRFLSERGSGTTADAIKAIDYAVENGAKIMSNSWGSEGEDSQDEQNNIALREAIKTAEKKGVLFIAAAGNGRDGVGYDNDADSKPAFPASYTDDIIISVAAIDANNALGAFSNFGAKTVDLAAPGVAVFSTMVGNIYSDVVIEAFETKVTWDGTSMATPHVAGAAAAYWAKYPNAKWRQVKAALMKSAVDVPGLQGKVASNGKLNVTALLKLQPRKGSDDEVGDDDGGTVPPPEIPVPLPEDPPSDGGW